MCHEALLYTYLALSTGDERWADWAEDRLNSAIDQANHLGHIGLHGGLSELGWTIEHVSQLLAASSSISGSSSTVNEDIDKVLIKSLMKSRWRGPYDLISGLVGIAVYFVERLPCLSAVRGLHLVLNHIEAAAVETEGGLAWLTPTSLLHPSQRERFPNGYYNLGVAHGVPGIIHLLYQLTSLGLEVERSGRLLAGGLTWLISQQRPIGTLSRYGWWVSGAGQTDSRLAWCYGDLGILGVVQQVSSDFSRPDWTAFTENLLRHCAAWPEARTGVVDASVCHGAAGVAHIFNRLYQSAGDIESKEAATCWFNRLLKMRSSGAGVGGFQTYRVASDRLAGGSWVPEPALIDGAIGIALSLLAAITPIAPQWDRMFLLSRRALRRSECF